MACAVIAGVGPRHGWRVPLLLARADELGVHKKPPVPFRDWRLCFHHSMVAGEQTSGADRSERVLAGRGLRKGGAAAGEG